MNHFFKAMQAWNKKTTKQKKTILHNAGRNPALASRSYPYLQKEVRQDIGPILLKEIEQEPAKTYWWQHI